MRVTGLNFYEAWLVFLDVVLEAGRKSKPRGMEIKELIGTSLYVEDCRQNIIVDQHRDLNFRFMVAEWLWILGGRNDVETVARYNKQIAKFSDDGETFAGAYGPRLKPQWGYVINTLKIDPDSRQAVASIWTPNPTPSKDIPCTLSAQFFIRRAKLHSVWTMRSNDLWLGLPYDFFNFSQLTNGLAGDLGLEAGSLTLNAGSSHIYQTNYEQVEQVLKNYDGECVDSPQLWYTPRANAILNAAIDERYPMSGFNDQERGYVEALRAPTKALALEHLKGIK